MGSSVAAADSGPPPPVDKSCLPDGVDNAVGVGVGVAPGSTLHAWVEARVQRLCKQALSALCAPERWVCTHAAEASLNAHIWSLPLHAGAPCPAPVQAYPDLDAAALSRPHFSSKHMLTWEPEGVHCLVLLCPMGFVFAVPRPGEPPAFVAVPAGLPHAVMDTVIDGSIVKEPGPGGSTQVRLLVGDVLVAGVSLGEGD